MRTLVLPPSCACCARISGPPHWSRNSACRAARPASVSARARPRYMPRPFSVKKALPTIPATVLRLTPAYSSRSQWRGRTRESALAPERLDERVDVRLGHRRTLTFRSLNIARKPSRGLRQRRPKRCAASSRCGRTGGIMNNPVLAARMSTACARQARSSRCLERPHIASAHVVPFAASQPARQSSLDFGPQTLRRPASLDAQ